MDDSNFFGFPDGAVQGPDTDQTNGSGITSTNGAHTHEITTTASTTGQSSGNTGNTGSGKAHTHSFTGSAVTSGST